MEANVVFNKEQNIVDILQLKWVLEVQGYTVDNVNTNYGNGTLVYTVSKKTQAEVK